MYGPGWWTPVSSSSTSVVAVSTPTPHPRPGPSGPDIDALRVTFDDLLADSAGPASTELDGGSGAVRDHQVEALDAAHELLAEALAALDTHR